MSVSSPKGAIHYPYHRSGAYTFKKHHKKPYRKRHIFLVLVMYLASIFSAIGVGLLMRSDMYDSLIPGGAVVNKSKSVSVHESGAYRYTHARGIFESSRIEESGVVLRTLRPDPMTSTGAVAASRMTIRHTELSQGAFIGSVPQSDDLFTVEKMNETEEFIAGIPFTKHTYKHTPKYSDTAASVYSLVWDGSTDQESVAIGIEGLIGSPDIPGLYAQIFASFEFSNGPDVLGLSMPDILTKKKEPSELSEKYIADSISPAVVKIYNIVCGVVYVEGRQVSQDGCEASVGSGFFVSSDGYVATNGHVVVFEPEDAFVQMLLNEPQVFADYLRSSGLSSQQIVQLTQRSDLLAAVIAEIYTLPKGTIELRQKEQVTLVAHGDDPLEVPQSFNFRELIRMTHTGALKKAELVASDYSSRDIYVVSSGDMQGFSSSDVALLKVDIDNTPFIRALSSSIVTQNQAISVLGFPADAENALIDNEEISVSVTNGSISSIRTAAGGDYRLYQSDADASQGSSGGPAITAEGHVFGLLTYRFKNDAVQDAAKSYIRDFDDVKRLALREGINFDQSGSVQKDWETGLRYFADNHYQASLEYFENVRGEYPSHRLASEYISAAKTAIENGRDVPASTINYLIIGTFIGVLGAGLGVVLMIRHHGRHKIYTLHFPHLPHHAA